MIFFTDDPSAAAGRKQNMLSVEESKDATPTKAGELILSPFELKSK
jgi:hypothetical protein